MLTRLLPRLSRNCRCFISDPKQEPLGVVPEREGVTVKLPAQAPDKIDSVVVFSFAGSTDETSQSL